MTVRPDAPNEIAFPPAQARFVRFLIHGTLNGQPCIDELEVYAPEGQQNLARASDGAKATASSCLSGYAIHQVPHLNDGRYGNSFSWIAAGATDEWAQIELRRRTHDRPGRFFPRSARAIQRPPGRRL